MDYPKLQANHHKSKIPVRIKTSSPTSSHDFNQKAEEVKLDIQDSQDKEFLDEIFNSSSSIDEEEIRYDASENESDDKDDEMDFGREKNYQVMKNGEKLSDKKHAPHEEKKTILDENDWKEANDNIKKYSLQLQGSQKGNERQYDQKLFDLRNLDTSLDSLSIKDHAEQIPKETRFQQPRHRGNLDQFGNKFETIGDQLWRKSSTGTVDEFEKGFQGPMRNKYWDKNGNKIGQGLWEQQNYPMSMGAYGDRNNFNGNSFGNYNTRRERLSDKKASPNGSLGRTTRTYAQLRKYTFEEFVHKLYDGKFPSLDTSNIDDNKDHQSNVSENKISESNNDNQGLRNVGEKPSLIPRVLLMKSRGDIPCKKGAIFQKKKPVIKNEVLEIIEDRFISFDTEDSSDDEFFTPNTSMEEDLDPFKEDLDPFEEKTEAVSNGSANGQQDVHVEAGAVNFEDGSWDMCLC